MRVYDRRSSQIRADHSTTLAFDFQARTCETVTRLCTGLRLVKLCHFEMGFKKGTPKNGLTKDERREKKRREQSMRDKATR